MGCDGAWGAGRALGASMPSKAVPPMLPVTLPGGGVESGGSGRNCLSEVRERGFHGMMTGKPESWNLNVTSRGL